MRSLVVASLAAAVVTVTPAPASAKLLELYARATAGGSLGEGLVGDLKADDFFAGASGASYGLRLGAEILFIEAILEHHQFTDFERIKGTWTQLLLGFDFELPLSPGVAPRTGLYLEILAAVGAGVGTGRQIDPPLDNSEITDKGFVAQAEVTLSYRISPVFRIGASLPLSLRYLIKNDVPVEGVDDVYGSVHLMGLGFIEVNFGL